MAIDAIHVETEPGRSPSPQAVFARGWFACRSWWVRRSTRRALADLTDEQLRDIGVSRSEARREAGKSFYWD